MFESFDFETLLKNMLDNVDDNMDKREGSIIYDALAPCAMELSNFYQGLDMVLDEVFAESASYAFLAKRAAERGILPREATPSVLKMVVSPVDSAVSIGDRFFVDDLNFTVTAVNDADDGSYKITCDTDGSVGNLTSGDLIPADTNNDLSDMTSASIVSVLTPGSDEEEEEDFRNRYFSSFTNISFGGNKQDYIDMVMEFDGVGGCKPIRVWNQGYNPSDLVPNEDVDDWFESLTSSDVGEDVYNWLEDVYTCAKNRYLTTGGTVAIYVIDSQYNSPTTSLIESIQEEIYPSTQDGIAPIGHVVTVHPVDEDEIDIHISATYEDGYSFNDLKDDIEDVVDSYLLELRRDWADTNNIIVRSINIEQQLIMITGFTSINSITINSQSVSYTLDSNAIPIRGDISG